MSICALGKWVRLFRGEVATDAEALARAILLASGRRPAKRAVR